MSDAKKQQFNGLVSKILDTLAAACPVPVEITVETFGLPKGAFDSSPAPSGFIGFVGSYNETPEEELLNSTLGWLAAEGFIRAGEHADHYVATLQTLTLRGEIPNALQ
ncbi:hypothetical protein J2X66_001976 [Pseudomonas sp. 3296]|uniref:hypothetical protein n=1 Tax=Pseudomonas sp. 3296 TaxID=2817753 RepID=UPI002863E4E4|nr:hypothetical protein [Pseudomonas sp. 3296]MDR6915111.1 hypothetical protein [Pseudomonas sp. 3296]